jgi:uncharacterized protein Smg (DUF494 family)
MQERIVEIIVYFMSELKNNKQFSDIDLSELSKRGYSESEINLALSWLVESLENGTKTDSPFKKGQDTSFRVLNDVEKDLFTADAWGSVIELHTLGILNNETIEAMIERGQYMGVKSLSVDQIKYFVSSLLAANDPKSYGNKWSLDGMNTTN